jgi:hypothetical protein
MNPSACCGTPCTWGLCSSPSKGCVVHAGGSTARCGGVWVRPNGRTRKFIAVMLLVCFLACLARVCPHDTSVDVRLGVSAYGDAARRRSQLQIATWLRARHVLPTHVHVTCSLAEPHLPVVVRRRALTGAFRMLTCVPLGSTTVETDGLLLENPGCPPQLECAL